MFAENRDIIEDNMIVEFRYDVTRDDDGNGFLCE